MKMNFITENLRGSRMIRKIFATLLLITISASATAVTENQEKISKSGFYSGQEGFEHRGQHSRC